MGQTEDPAAASADLDRAQPQCPHFGRCGGCQLQDMAYAAQLGHKAAQLRARLDTTGLALPEIQVHPSPPYAYRNRIRLTLAEVDGQLRAGYIRGSIDPRAGRSRSGWSDAHSPDAEDGGSNSTGLQWGFLPITQCPIAAPILWRAAEALLALASRESGGWLRSPEHALDQLELFTDADESRLQLSLYLRARTGRAARSVPAKLAAAFTALCESLRMQIPELGGAGSFLLPPKSAQRSRRAEQPRPGPAWGAPGLSYSVPTRFEAVIPSAARNLRSSHVPLPALEQTGNRQPATAFWIPRGAFFQINRFLIPELLALVTGGRSGQLAWDLYAGVGLFSRALATHFDRITAVEIAEPAASALAATGLANLRAVKAATLDFLRAAAVERDRPSLIVLDPPRSGAGPEVCELLGRIAAPTLIYISCSPEALPGDLAALAASRYSIAEVHLVDLFPQTTHIETVAILRREQSRGARESREMWDGPPESPP